MPLFKDADFESYSQPIQKMLNQDYRARLEELWKRFQPYAHSTFQNEFLRDPNKFDSLAWEMLLAEHLLKYGYTLDKIASSNSPDLCVLMGDLRVWIECVVPERGDPTNPDKVPEPIHDKCVEIDKDKNTLRCIKALNDKAEQYSRWEEKNLVDENDIKIIALNAKNLTLTICDERFPDIFRALYGMGDLCFSIDRNNLDDSRSFYEIKSEITRNSGKKISTHFFENDMNKKIDGVIFSNDWISYTSMVPEYCFVQNINNLDKLKDMTLSSGFQTYQYSHEHKRWNID